MNPETGVANLASARADAQTARILSSESEVGRSFATLAENLRSLGRPIRSVVVTGPEAGVGRTTICLGLGTALAAAGKKVTVVDCNLDRPQLHRWFGRPNFTGLTSALEGGVRLDDYGFDAAPNLRVVPTGPVLPGPWGLAGSPKLAGSSSGPRRRQGRSSARRAVGGRGACPSGPLGLLRWRPTSRARYPHPEGRSTRFHRRSARRPHGAIRGSVERPCLREELERELADGPKSASRPERCGRSGE